MFILKLTLPVIVLLTVAGTVSGVHLDRKNEEPRILVFSKTEGFRHSSIEVGISAIQALGETNGFNVDTTEDAMAFTESNLNNYDAVVFLNTTKNVLNNEQQDAFKGFIQAGGGFVGIHSATDTEYDWPWYGRLVGAYFLSHPNNPNVRTGMFRVLDKDHESTHGLPDRVKREDEFYNFKSINPDIKVLVDIDESSYEGGTNGDHHPMSWYHEYDGGRAWYTAMGHTEETYSEPFFLQHLLGGIRYAIGSEKLTYMNEPPQVDIDLTGCNRTFYFEGVPIQYSVRVTDEEDGSIGDGGIDPSQVVVTAQYFPKGQKIHKSIQSQASPTMPHEGTYMPPGGFGEGSVMLRAAYKDRGVNGSPGIISEETIHLRSPKIDVSTGELSDGVIKFSGSQAHRNLVVAAESGSYIRFPGLYLTALSEIHFIASVPSHIQGRGGIIEVRLDAPDGPVIGQTSFIDSPTLSHYPVSIEATTGDYDVYFVFKNDEPGEGELFGVMTAEFIGERS